MGDDAPKPLCSEPGRTAWNLAYSTHVGRLPFRTYIEIRPAAPCISGLAFPPSSTVGAARIQPWIAPAAVSAPAGNALTTDGLASLPSHA